VGIIVILALSVGLALAMLMANIAVGNRIDALRDSMSTTLTLYPAGVRNLQGSGDPLTGDQLDAVADLENVDSVNPIVSGQVEDAATKAQKDAARANGVVFGGPDGLEADTGSTSLTSGIDPPEGELQGPMAGQTPPAPPITVVGTDVPVTDEGASITLTDGEWYDGDDEYSAVVGQDLAEANDLQIGDTFTAWDKTFTVVGIFDADSTYDNNKILAPLATMATILDKTDEYTKASVEVDDIAHLDSVADAIKDTIGEDKVDLVQPDQDTASAIDSLKSVDKISIIGFLLAIGAAAIVVLFTMLMIVRERRREIGVLKAIGGSKRHVVLQFVAEAITFAVLGTLVGLGFAVATSGAMANALVSSNVDDSSSNSSNQGAGGPQIQSGPKNGPMATDGKGDNGPPDAKELIGDVTSSVGLPTLGYGLGAALAIAILGSAVPAYLISRISPAQALRTE
jgi:putative ABC transport system permease protein